MKIGSLFTGYGGLDWPAAQVLGGRVVWHCDNDPAASTLLAHHWPNIPNHGDITTVDWSRVEPVDVLTGGFPCQDVSLAGRRAGLTADSRTGLWAHMTRAIAALRPALVIAENVRGLLSATADSDMEPCPWCLGDRADGGMRALGAVLADLADLGYDAAWCGVRAADVGACHGRYRVFIIAADTRRERGYRGGLAVAEQAESGRACDPSARRSGTPGELELLPTPVASMQGPSQRELDADNPNCRLETAVALLPTPTARDGKGANQRRDETCLHGALLPTPRASDGVNGGPNMRGSSGDLALPSAVQPERWGKYATAIARHETVFGRPAPEPTVRGTKGGNVLNPELPEWMMGLPAGWITTVPGLTRNAQLKLAGNGVVPQQAAAALDHLLPHMETP